MSLAEKSIRTIPFTGKSQDYRMWSRKFTSMATIKGYRGIMTGKETPPGYLVDVDESTVQEKER